VSSKSKRVEQKLTYLTLNVFSIIVGIACIAIASRWPKSAAQLTFVLFALSAFALSGLLSLSSHWLTEKRSYSPTLMLQLNWLHFAQQINSVVSLSLLVLFTTKARSLLNGLAIEPTTQSLSGPSWNTELDRQQRVNISTKRNLAFLVDYIPMMMAYLALIYTFTISLRRIDNPSSGETVFLFFFSAFALLGPAYIVLKDSYGGRSVGKRLFGCQVVCERTGQPIGSVSAVLRNLIYLLPIAPLIEFLTSSIRSDGNRLGDLLGQTRVVSGPPQFMDGVPVPEEVVPQQHPLDNE